MARKKKESKEDKLGFADPNVIGLQGAVIEQPISRTLEDNYMPYAMSVIISRAIPEIDGFKPSHRKLLYTMYKMGLLNGNRTKSANIVGQTMQLNPHGDTAIYETMVRLARGNEALLHPYVDSKGNFGKTYSRDMAYAASRYTEARLAPICAELFRDIDEDTVDFVDNYDNTKKEPSLLPTSFPNVLVSNNSGIAVGMASNICGFNLEEVCRATIELIKDPEADILQIMPAPDFSTGGEILYNADEMRQIYDTGRGSIKIRGRWRYVPDGNLIEIFEIPYTTTIEQIHDKVAELSKAGKLPEISDMRDETDLSGLKLTIDLKRGSDPERVMAKLSKMTSFQDSFGCNFNILIAGQPKVMGVREIIEEWTAWRVECVRRRLYFELTKKKDKLHLLKGLARILLDIDKAIKIIRETESDAEVIPNLMIGFGIDQVQAEYVAEIKLRNINKEYILKRTDETSSLEREIDEIEDTLGSQKKVRRLIITELENVIKKFAQPRKTGIVYESEMTDTVDIADEIPDYPVTVFLTEQGYLKKIKPQSLRIAADQKYKEGDQLYATWETTNNAELLVFTDQYQVYKARFSDFTDTKASALGDYIPGKLGFAESEAVAGVCEVGDYSGFLLFVFENGKVAKIPISAYKTTTNRKKLTGAYSDKSKLKSIIVIPEEEEIALYTTDGRALVFSSAQLLAKTTRTSQGVSVMTSKKKAVISGGERVAVSAISNVARYRAKTIPGAGLPLKNEDVSQKQLSFDI